MNPATASSISGEASPDGSIYVADSRGSPPSIRRYDASGKLLGTMPTSKRRGLRPSPFRVVRQRHRLREPHPPVCPHHRRR